MKTTATKKKARRDIKASRIAENKKRINALKAEGYSNEAIAKALGIPENAVKLCGKEN